MRTLSLLMVLLACAGQALAADAGALRVAVAAEQARAPAAPQPREAFLDSRAVQVVRLSPDGRHVAYLRDEGEARSLWLLSTGDGGDARRLLPRTDADSLLWSHDGRWLFLASPRSLASLSLDGGGGVRVPLMGLERRRLMQVDSSQPAAVILRERVRDAGGERWRIVRMDARGQRSVLREDPRWVHDVAFDAQGRLVGLSRFEGGPNEAGYNAIHHVEPDGSLRMLRRLEPMARGELLAAMADGSLLLRGETGGNLGRLLRLGIDGTLRTLHVDPRGKADLEQVALDPVTQEPLVVSYRSTVAATYGLGPARDHVDAIVAHFPGRDVGIEVGRGADAWWLVSERDSTLRDPHWHLYDPRTGAFRSILEQGRNSSRALPEASLARKIAFSYPASDGMQVRGFLLLPPGADPATLPLVAHVHGGPINHFRPGYDGIAQMLANRGYAVFQSNFRGSTGHGREYMFASRGDYGNGRVQQDIVDGVRHLLARGIGDPDRIGIVGHSFGGYSALLGVTFAPDLFKVGVAGAPPADLAWSMQWLLDAGDQGDLPDRSLLASLQALRIDPTDPATYARLHAQSPAVNAALMRRPLLLMAGAADRTVAIREVVHYAAKLQTLGKPVTLYVEPNGGHSPRDPLPREAYAYLMESMLHAHLGGAAPEPPGARLKAYLRANIRLAGPEFAGRKPAGQK
ncbi:MAG: prolyl oligopeptidase family serine peptidase [Pseudomonadota bacterium]|nr:prolyl oligopeptidase family serine peptidase [Pseudomonadota bacterium]